MTNSKGVTLSELLIVIIIFIATFILLTPLVNKIRDRANDIKCSNNLRLISLALHLYAADNNEDFPPSLSALYPKYIKDEKIFDCPATSAIGTAEKSDYYYVQGLTESSSPTDVIIYDRDGNHKKRGRNLVRINGSVEWVRSFEGKPR